MTDSPSEWHRIRTVDAFKDAFADKTFVGEGLAFTIHADGRMTGVVGTARLDGRWVWRGEFFCRTASLDGEDLGMDCEVIEMRPGALRYTRNAGTGTRNVVIIQPTAD